MGASDFYVRANGKTAKEAFDRAVEHAKYESGHGGYTGTIAEKTGFVMIEIGENHNSANHVADDVLDDDDHPVNDKWGPAGCVKVLDREDEYLFFGVASS